MLKDERGTSFNICRNKCAVELDLNCGVRQVISSLDILLRKQNRCFTNSLSFNSWILWHPRLIELNATHCAHYFWEYPVMRTSNCALNSEN